MSIATIVTEPFTCPSCVAKIESTLAKVNGVEQVKVLFHSNKVKVNFDNALVSSETLSDTVARLGYPVEKVSVA